MKKVILFYSLIFSTLLFAETVKIPRQKITISGLTKASKEYVLTGLDFEKFKKQSVIELYDPYDGDKLNLFNSVPFYDFLIEYSSPEAKIASVMAYDGYKVNINLEDAKKIGLYFAYKDKKGFLGLDQMGPIRIIENRKGKIDKTILTHIGVNWVWQVKNIELKK